MRVKLYKDELIAKFKNGKAPVIDLSKVEYSFELRSSKDVLDIRYIFKDNSSIDIRYTKDKDCIID